MKGRKRSIFERINGQTKPKDNQHISARELAKISRENRRITDKIERQRNRKNVPESEYLTSMKNPENVVEFDNLHTYFFTDIGTVKAVDGVSFEIPKGKTVGVVGESNSAGVYNMYPHELSGGMRQRIMIAMALACNPKLIIADEPTTALDVTIQAQILDLLRNLKDKINSSIMLITHDLGVIAEMADYVVVMYAGRVVEKGTAIEVFKNPQHPYTVGLMASKPVINRSVERLYTIPGNVPNPINMPNYCYFRDRCEQRIPACDGEYPPEAHITQTHMATCYRCVTDQAQV
ncbi:MAG: hypothetical protein B5M51_08235 [Anaerolinea sp. 4484_236]|nr:MAG: hypothetical protein B5M51_08235 [Anaerolinea sp. 4484_236]